MRETDDLSNSLMRSSPPVIATSDGSRGVMGATINDVSNAIAYIQTPATFVMMLQRFARTHLPPFLNIATSIFISRFYKPPMHSIHLVCTPPITPTHPDDSRKLPYSRFRCRKNRRSSALSILIHYTFQYAYGRLSPLPSPLSSYPISIILNTHSWLFAPCPSSSPQLHPPPNPLR